MSYFRPINRIFSATLRGFVPASGGGVLKFLNAEGDFVIPAGGGSPTLKETEIDFGVLPFITSGVFNVIDTDITADSIIMAQKAIKTTSDLREIDEIIVESLDVSAKANDGSLDIYVNALVGPVTGKFIINYIHNN